MDTAATLRGPESLLQDKRVAVAFTGLKGYPAEIPFDPPERYPEYPLKGVDRGNLVYRWVRETLFRAGLDRENFGTAKWNPLGDFIRPGMKVLIKPNTVSHMHEERKEYFSVVIHPSILRPVLDYLCIALKGQGKITIGDSQVIFGHFEEAMVATKIDKLLAWYRQQASIPIECMDLRTVRGVRTWMYGKWGRKEVNQDPLGFQTVDLGNESYFKDIDPKRLRIAIASYKKMCEHHSGGRHEYVFPKTVLDCDAIINIPKLKTHRRTAVTLALKNFMGLPASKACLPHFRTGSVEEGGDQYIYPSWRKRVCLVLHDQIQTRSWVPLKFMFAVLKKIVWDSHKIIPFKDDVYEAMWHGNDTLWRTVLDLNRIVFYADKSGILRDKPQRAHFCLIDGIVAGEGNGPLSPNPLTPGVLIAGYNSAAVDAVAASFMGFDIEKIPLVKRALEDEKHSRPIFRGSPEKIEVIQDDGTLSLAEVQRLTNLKFVPHPNWVGHVERGQRQS
jgi:uncharacterized protein (DUF362 family)